MLFKVHPLELTLYVGSRSWLAGMPWLLSHFLSPAVSEGCRMCEFSGRTRVNYTITTLTENQVQKALIPKDSTGALTFWWETLDSW